MSEFSAVAIDAAEEEKHDGMNCDEDNDNRTSPSSPTVWSSRNVVLLKCLMSGVVLYAALLAYVDYQQQNKISGTFVVETETELLDDMQQQRRRLTAVIGEIIPSYMKELNVDLAERKKLFDDTPPEEVKYWFEYRGPLQVSIKTIRSSSSNDLQLLLWRRKEKSKKRKQCVFGICY